MSVTILELDGVSKSFDKQSAVSDVSISVQKGEFIALMGPSGCGKTTTLRMIAGLDAPTEGQIRIWGRDVSQDAPWRRDTPLVWQSYALFPFMSVRRNVEFGLKQRGMIAKDRAAKADEWLERMGIEAFAERMPHQLSGGQRQRVALARALATEPELLLLDEPLSALDPHLKVSMQTELVRLHRELGITFVCVTHSHSEAFAMADRVVIMDKGTVQQVGAPQQIHRRADNRFVAEFLGASNILDVKVLSADASGVTADSAIGRLRTQAPPPKLVQADDALSLVVAMDRVEIAKSSSGAFNQVPGRIAMLEVMGASITAIVETEGGVMLRSQLSSRDMENNPLVVGDTVVASWDPASAYFVAQ